MDPIRFAIERPVAVVALVVMAVLFGILALSRIPIQLAPDVRKPIVVVETNWPGAAPVEIEREIINPQEEAFRGLEGLEIMTSSARTGRAQITLEFAIGSQMGDFLLLVSNRLDRVGNYPAEAGEPRLNTSGADDSPIAWVVAYAAQGNTRFLPEYGDFMEDVVKERLERIDGVSTVNVFGGVSQELQIVIRPEELARFGLTIPQVVARLRAENVSLSAGDVDEGKRRYVVRADGNLNTIDAIESVVLRSEAMGQAGSLGRVRVADVANVAFSYKEPTARLRFRGEPALAFNIVREQGANVIATMDEVKQVLAELSDGPVADAGLRLEQVYDETVYIEGAIDLVTQNIWIGGLLAAAVLLLLLPGFHRRHFRRDGGDGTHAQRHFTGRYRLRGRHDRRCRHRCAGKYLPAQGTRQNPARGSLSWCQASLGRDPCVGPDDGHGVHPDPRDGTRSRPAVPRHRRRNLGLGAVVADRGSDRDPRPL